MKRGEKETRVESEGVGVPAAAEAIAGHRPTRTTKPRCTSKRSTACGGGSAAGAQPKIAKEGGGGDCSCDEGTVAGDLDVWAD